LCNSFIAFSHSRVHSIRHPSPLLWLHRKAPSPYPWYYRECYPHPRNYRGVCHKINPITALILLYPSPCSSLVYLLSLLQSTGASIQVANEMLPGSTERAVTVSGSPDAIAPCIQRLCAVAIEVCYSIFVATLCHPYSGFTAPFRNPWKFLEFNIRNPGPLKVLEKSLNFNLPSLKIHLTVTQ